MPSLPIESRSVPPARALLCPRVSGDAQADGTSLETQEKYMRARALERGWRVVGVEADIYSGADELRRRPQFHAISRAVAQRSADVVLFYEPGRMARDMGYAFITLELCESNGAQLHFVTREYERRPDGRLTPQGKLMLSVDVFGNEYELGQKMERAARAKNDMAEAGELIPVGLPPIGYVKVDRGRQGDRYDAAGRRTRRRRDVRYEVEPKGAKVVSTIVRLFLRGWKLRRIAELLNRAHVPAPAAWMGRTEKKGVPLKGCWRANAVRRVLVCDYYYGRPTQRRWVLVKNPETGKKVARLRPAEQHAPIRDGSIPPLLAPEMCAAYENVLAQLERNRAESPRRTKDPTTHLLRYGIARCGYCDRPLQADSHRDRGQRVYTYTCERNREPDQGCRFYRTRAHLIDEWAWGIVRSVLLRPEVVAERVAAQAAEPDPLLLVQLEAARSAAAEAERRVANYRKRLGMDLDEETAALMAADLKASAQAAASAAAERDRLQAELDRAAAEAGRVQEAVDWVRRVGAKPDGPTWEKKRLALAALGARVLVYASGGPVRFALELRLPVGEEARKESFVCQRSR
ncbi:MAG TPA: recombinase family protein [Chloroflexota bacterium]|nr:recombinase family protein [Chloroflexota bacterium]